MKKTHLISVAWMFVASAPALAQNALTPGALELYPTFEAVGARVAYVGDADGDASGWLEWRLAGEANWRRGAELVRITNNRFAASVLWLAEDRAVEVRAVLADPDGGGGSVGGATRTRALPPSSPSGRTWWVAVAGSDSADGSSGAPLRTIQAAADRAQPGDAIRMRPGIYYQKLDTPRAGTPAAPIHLVADAPGAILDGSDPAYLRRSDWRDDAGGVFSVPFAGVTRLVAADDSQRLYGHASLAGLRASENGVTQGWVVEGGRLYVRLEGGDSPAGHVMHVARYDQGVFVDQNDWRVEGLEIRHFGTSAASSGIMVRAANRVVVRSNVVHTIGGKMIWLRVGSSDALVEGNVVFDPRISTWPWAAVKSHAEELAGISNRAGRGNVLRRNTVSGTFDGLDCGGSATGENDGADADLSQNVVANAGDDAFEPETIDGINVRVWGNRVDRCFSGISIAPITQGPMYVLRNTLTNVARSAFKHSLSSVGVAIVAHNTSATTVPNSCAVWPSGPWANVMFRNNVFVGLGMPAVNDDPGESQAGCSFDGDVMWSGAAAPFRWKGVNYATVAALRSATGFERAGRFADPRLANVSNGDVALLAGSPAIDAGLVLFGLNDGFLGAAPDAGALEFGAPNGDTTPPAPILDLR